MSAISLPGSARVVIRQHRRAFWGVCVLALVGITALVGVVLWPDPAVDAFANSGCSVENTVRGCGDIVRDFLDSEHRSSQAVGYATGAMVVLPAFIGLFVAGPMIGRELESGTYKLAWTQSVSPARWLATKLAVPAVLTLAGVAVLSAVCAWGRSQTGQTSYPLDAHDRAAYGSIGTVPVGYALCMLALGALAGLVLRHTVAAMVTTVIGYGVLTVTLNAVRNHLWPTVNSTYVPGAERVLPDGATAVSWGWLTADSERLPDDACRSWGADVKQCLADKGITRGYVDYRLDSHFWPLQLVETGILLALAALAVLLAFRVLRRRHG
ncbi:ABC transporter permease subunit [Streptomyces sp. NPDC001834]|uniref:ABC transporter permease subunit n=1 Tax=unclassified Streptomyces TaxID=2593676 RepID=UPI0034140303